MNQLKRLEIHHLLWLALGLALLGSLRHLAHIFGSVDGNWFAGWLQAIAVDAGLFALAYSLKARETRRRVVWLGIAMFTGISIYGNLAYGMLKMNEGGVLPTWIIWSKPYILAASLPVLVLYLAELVSENRQRVNDGDGLRDALKQAGQKVSGLESQLQEMKAQAAHRGRQTQEALSGLQDEKAKLQAEIKRLKSAAMDEQQRALFNGDVDSKIKAMKSLWPDLPQNAIAAATGASESKVSRTLRNGNDTNGNGVK